MADWDPEIVVDTALATKLIGQFPDLTIESLEPVAEGWDRGVWLVNERWAFGFPRRQIVIPGMEREIAFLPRLAPLLPLPIPNPVFLGRPCEEFPWPFFGCEFIAGTEAGEVELADADRASIGLDLASFLRRLHSDEVAKAIDGARLPVDPFGRADMGKRVPLARQVIAEAESVGLWSVPDIVRDVLDEGDRLPPPRPPVVVHGDLHFRQFLVEQRRASGVIDWVDLSRADPAIDLQLLWSFLAPDDRPAFLDAYGPVAHDQLIRARVIALWLSAILATFGRAQGLSHVESEAVASFHRATQG